MSDLLPSGRNPPHRCGVVDLGGADGLLPRVRDRGYHTHQQGGCSEGHHSACPWRAPRHMARSAGAGSAARDGDSARGEAGPGVAAGKHHGPKGTGRPDGTTPVQGNLAGYVFTISGGGTTSPLPPTNAQGLTSISVAAGTYTITEAAMPGSTLLNFRLAGTNTPIANFSVPSGGTASLIARNQVAGTGSIQIVKQIVDANSMVIAMPTAAASSSPSSVRTASPPR